MVRKVLVTANVHAYLIEKLESYGFKVIFIPGIGDEALLHAVTDIEGLIVTTREVNSQVIDKAEKLKWIGR